MKTWYYLSEDQSVQGPVSSQVILELHACGTLTDETSIAETGSSEWVRLADAGGDLQPAPPPPPMPAPPGSPPPPACQGAPEADDSNDASAKLLNTSKQIGRKAYGHARTFAHRIIRSNFIDDKVTEPEWKELNLAGVQSPMAQSYLGWRRALIWFGAVFLSIALLFSIKDNIDMLGYEHPLLFKLLLIAAMLSPMVACFFLFRAALDWTKVKKTRSFARLSWFFLLVVPILLAMVPASKLFSGNHFSSLGERQMFGLMWGTIMLLTIAPSLLGMFPAIIRSSLTIKTLLPESPMPGWVAAIVSPFYALFFIMILIIAIQVDELMLSLSMFCFAVAPAVILMHASRLVQPAPEAEAIKTVTTVRRKAVVAVAIGLGAIFIWFLNNLDDWHFNYRTFITFISKLLASFMVLTVVTSDFLIGIFKIANDRETILRSGGMADSLGNRFADLDNLGLTELRAGEAELLQRIQGRGSK